MREKIENKIKELNEDQVERLAKIDDPKEYVNKKMHTHWYYEVKRQIELLEELLNE